MDTPSTSNSSPTRDLDAEPPVLSPQGSPDPAPTSRRTCGRKNTFWDESKEIVLLELVEREVTRLKHQHGPAHKPSFREVIRTVVQQNPIYQRCKIDSVCQKVRNMRNEMSRDVSRGAQVQSQKYQILMRLGTILPLHITKTNALR